MNIPVGEMFEENSLMNPEKRSNLKATLAASGTRRESRGILD
jgi:hypothetical protein